MGQTNEVNQRLKRHNTGQVKSTKGGVPWKLIKVFELSSRSTAVKLESRIKSRGIERFLNDR